MREIVERQKTALAVRAFDHGNGAIADVEVGKTIERHVHDGADERFDRYAVGNERDASATGGVFFRRFKCGEGAALNSGHAFSVRRNDTLRIGKVCGGFCRIRRLRLLAGQPLKDAQTDFAQVIAGDQRRMTGVGDEFCRLCRTDQRTVLHALDGQRCTTSGKRLRLRDALGIERNIGCALTTVGGVPIG